MPAASADIGAAATRHQVADDQAGEHAVAGGRQICEHDVSRLLPADREVVNRHRRDHVAVAHRGLDDADTCGRQRAAQAEVRHHRDRDRVVAQHPALVPVERGHHHDLVAVDQVAVLVDREDAVGVAVEREAELRASLTNRGLQRLGMRRSAPGVDVPAVGRVVDDVYPGAGRLERVRCEIRRRAVGAVDHDVHA